jgi:hypothetical protein
MFLEKIKNVLPAMRQPAENKAAYACSEGGYKIFTPDKCGHLPGVNIFHTTSVAL